MVEDKSYPLGVKDLAPVLRSIKDKKPDAFIGLTYPPDTILASRQSKEIGFNPKFFYAIVGTAFQLYRNVMQAGAEGVLGMGSWNSKTSAGAKAYFDAHVKKFGGQGARPLGQRRTAGPAWRSCTNAVAKVGLDRKAIRDYVAGTSTRPSSATSGSPAARTSARRARWASGRTASSRWCGRRIATAPLESRQAGLGVGPLHDARRPGSS